MLYFNQRGKEYFKQAILSSSNRNFLSSALPSKSEGMIMNTEQQARALMNRQQQAVKNRQQSMLERAANEIGLDGDQKNQK